MKRIDKEEKSYLKLANKLEDEKEITQKNEYWINNLIEKEKELKVISLERVKEEKRIELAGKELKKEQDHELRKQKYEDLFKNLQTLKDDIFHLRSYTGHSIQETEINQSVMNFKFS